MKTVSHPNTGLKMKLLKLIKTITMKHTHHTDPLEHDAYERDTTWIIVALAMGIMILGCAVIYFVVGPLLEVIHPMV